MIGTVTRAVTWGHRRRSSAERARSLCRDQHVEARSAEHGSSVTGCQRGDLADLHNRTLQREVQSWDMSRTWGHRRGTWWDMGTVTGCRRGNFANLYNCTLQREEQSCLGGVRDLATSYVRQDAGGKTTLFSRVAKVRRKNRRFRGHALAILRETIARLSGCGVRGRLSGAPRSYETRR